MSFLHKNNHPQRPSFPKPDRSAFSPRPLPGDIDSERDVGWAEGKWKDGRPYRAELWSWESLSVVTFFFSALGLEDAGEAELAGLLEKESLVEFFGAPKAYMERVLDSSGNEMWLVSVPLRKEKEDLGKLGFQLNPYSDLVSRPKLPHSRVIRNGIFALGARKL